MKRKLWILSLASILFFVPLVRIGNAGQSKALEPNSKMKSEISKRIAKGKTRVKLKLRSGAEVKGRLEQAGDDSFTLTDEKSGRQISVAYNEVQRVKGHGLGTGAKIGIIGGIAVTAAVIIVLVSFHNFDPFKNGIVLR